MVLFMTREHQKMKKKSPGPEFLLPKLPDLLFHHQPTCGQSTCWQSQPNEEVESGQPRGKSLNSK